jgi:hypothetical protein
MEPGPASNRCEKRGESYAAEERDSLSPTPTLEGRTRDAKSNGSLGQRQRRHAAEPTSLEDLVGCLEDSLSASLGCGFSPAAFVPKLDVAATILGAR